jgi:poly(hydroxyalkanoate) depolymerase family esterase
MVLMYWRAAAVAVMAAMMPNGGSSRSPAAPPVEAESSGRFVDGTFTSDAGSRRWKLWVPTGYDTSRRYPLIVMLHGCTQDPDDLARGTRVAEVADRVPMLVLLPEQPESANPKKCWNWYDAAHQRRGAGEPALIEGMTRQVSAQWAVDASRVYVAGISAGAAMAANVVVSYPDVFAAVGLHSGIPYRAATNVMQGVAAMASGAADTATLATAAFEAMGPRARPIPALIVHGADDPVVKLVNATHTRDAWVAMNALARGEKSAPAGPPYEPGRVSEAQDRGLEFRRECHGTRVARERYCEVETLVVRGLGHAWSGGSKLGTFTDERGPDAMTEIVRFLLAHPMPAGRPNAARP